MSIQKVGYGILDFVCNFTIIVQLKKKPKKMKKKCHIKLKNVLALHDAIYIIKKINVSIPLQY